MDGPRGYTIATLCFNNESITLCETLDRSLAYSNRASYLTTWRHECTIADYIPTYLQHISSMNAGSLPDVLIFADQESRYPGSYLHSHLLPDLLESSHKLLKRTKMQGVGVTTYKGALSGDPSARGLRTSIYVKNYLYADTLIEEKDIRSVMSYDGQTNILCSDMLTRGKGATVSYIKLPKTEILAVVNCHLPFNANSLIKSRKLRNKMIRQTQLNSANSCFNHIFEEAVINSPLKPRHLIMTGDINYRIDIPMLADEFYRRLIQNPTPEDLYSIYITFDELHSQMRKGTIYPLEEGVNNSGPLFFPTCKMIKGRPRNIPTIDPNEYGKFVSGGKPGKFPIKAMTPKEIRNVGPIPQEITKREQRGDTEYNLGKYYQRIPSWCDRILYTNFDHEDVEWEKDSEGNSIWSMDTMWNASSYVGSYFWSASQKQESAPPPLSSQLTYPKVKESETPKSVLRCVYYDRFDVGEAMNKSDHAGVMSIHHLVLNQ